jgi:hypothetical protein
MTKKKVTILLPLNFNDGSKVPRSEINAILQECFDVFGGWTVPGKTKGAYPMKSTGKQQTDRALEVWVAVPEDQVSVLRRMTGAFAARLRQESLYFEVTGSTVEFILPLIEEEPTQEEPKEEEPNHD